METNALETHVSTIVIQMTITRIIGSKALQNEPIKITVVSIIQSKIVAKQLPIAMMAINALLTLAPTIVVNINGSKDAVRIIANAVIRLHALMTLVIRQQTLVFSNQKFVTTTTKIFALERFAKKVGVSTVISLYQQRYTVVLHIFFLTFIFYFM